MNTSLPEKDHAKLPFSLAREVDRTCDRFEGAWRAEQRPCIEDFLTTVPPEAREVLLAELIGLEARYRRRAGESPRPEDYAGRFPALDPAWLANALAAAPEPDTVPEAPPTLEPGGTGWPAIPDYDILGVLGEGGMGIVYKARHHALQRLVALKMILSSRPADAPALLARFRAEAEALARLQHPNIVQIFEVGEAGDQPYLALEYLEGGSLDKHLAGTPQPPRAAARLVEVLARAVHAAHQGHIIHRDLKPANILLQAIPGVKPPAAAEGTGAAAVDLDRWVPKITDFGVAKFLDVDRGQTQTGAVMGTPSYMAPEQARGRSRAIGPATDTYTLGAILYELLTGRPPFKGTTPVETLEQVVSQDPVSPKRLQPKTPADLVTICLKCLEKEPGRRYASALALADDLRRFQAGETIRARPVGVLTKGVKWARKRPAAAALVGVVGAVLIGGLAGGLWYAERERARAERESSLRQQAEEEKRIAEAVRTFLHDLLRQANPVEQANAVRQAGRGSAAKENPTVKELLDRAAAELTPEKIEAKFPQQPEVQASILRTVGETYKGIAEPDKAVEFLTRSSDAYRHTFGADHPDTLTTLNILAMAYLDAGKTAEAIALSEQVRAAQLRTLGADHPSTLATLHNLATAYRVAGEPAKAIPLFEQVRDAELRTLGADHPSTLATSNNLGLAYQRVGKAAKAIPLLEQVRDAELRTLGADHPHTLVTLNNLALAYGATGKTAEAIALLEQVRDGCVKQLGANHPHTLSTLNSLALAYQATGKLEQALPLFQQAATGIEKRQFVHPVAGQVVSNLAACQERLKQYEPAEAWRRKWLAVVKESAGPESAAYAAALAGLGTNLLQQHKHAAAVKALRDCLVLHAKQQPDAWTTFDTKSLLGDALLGQQKYAEAEPLLKDGYTGMKQRAAKMPPKAKIRLPEALERLVRLYEATGQKEEAARWRQELEALRSRPKAGKK